MPILKTAKRHFDHDMARSRALCRHAASLGAHAALADDILRGSLMLAVAAADAYFCDAFADLISRSLRAKDLQPGIRIPDRINNLRIPVASVIREAAGGWRWRMAARELMEDASVLSLDDIRKLFNQFFDDNNKLLNEHSLESWIVAPTAKSRLFGITRSAYRRLAQPLRPAARKTAMRKFSQRYQEIFQRRHDCIHNCDRPKVALQAIEPTLVQKYADDVEFLVVQCHDALRARFPSYLSDLGFSATTRNQVCM